VLAIALMPARRNFLCPAKLFIFKVQKIKTATAKAGGKSPLNNFL
jgi:hypothetical protein